MHHPSRILTTAFIPLLLAACDRAPEPSPRATALATAGATGGDPAAVAGPQQGPVDIEIRMVDGRVVTSPDSITVRRSRRIQWVAPDAEDRTWVVVFPEGTPFPNGRRVFNGRGNPNAAGGSIANNALGEYKYWVFFPDDDGNYVVVDPKLVVIDDRGGRTEDEEELEREERARLSSL